MTSHHARHAEPDTSFRDDLSFLRQHTEVVLLQGAASAAQVVVAPAWQGRVMTSSTGAGRDASYGWINRELIASGVRQAHINVFGGEDRLWLGPEGGQFSIFFAKGARFELNDWFTPTPIDTMPYEVVERLPDSVTCEAAFDVTNYSGARFEICVRRQVKVLDDADAWRDLGLVPVPGLAVVAFESDNRIGNEGADAWTKETGLLSIWILGMFNPAPTTTIVVPIAPGPDGRLGPKVTSDYFGPVPPDRLVVGDEALLFKGDGRFRSKIGVSPRRSRGVLGSYDAAGRTLTVVQFSQPSGRTDYVNSQWKLQDDPFAGDAANAYNDGPPAPGAAPLGPFYELESSSPAAALEPGATARHVHRTIHLSGPEEGLDQVARAVLGVPLDRVRSAFAATRE